MSELGGGTNSNWEELECGERSFGEGVRNQLQRGRAWPAPAERSSGELAGGRAQAWGMTMRGPAGRSSGILKVHLGPLICFGDNENHNWRI